MQLNNEWKDYEIIATGGGQKLERWGDIVLLRPDPQVIWPASFDLAKYDGLHARYTRSSDGGGKWEILKSFPDSWVIKWRDFKFHIAPTGFKHTGLFPEQAVNWAKLYDVVSRAKTPKILNLFAYTGAASIVCAAAGGQVCHVDAAKGMVEKAGANARANGISNIRFIVDDCLKFVRREITRGNKYDAIIMDPPSFGRGPDGEMWKLEDNLFPLVAACEKLLYDKPLFFLINSYTTGLQPAVLNNVLSIAMKNHAGTVESYEVCLPTCEKGVVLPAGASGLFIGEQK